MQNPDKIIEGCRKMKKKSQKALYEIYSPVLYGMALRYSSDSSEADDILQDAFIKIFTNIKQYKGTGSFEGWIKKILVNSAIGYIRKYKKQHFDDFNEINETRIKNFKIDESDFTKEELMTAINKLPEGFRLIFNLYAIEGYKHKEIAEMLNIKTGTSKSQYSRARKILQHKLLEMQKMPNEKSQ